MDIETKISKEDNLRTHKITGKITLAELLGGLTGVYSSPDFDPNMNSLWDLREADVSSISASDIQKTSELVTRHLGTGTTGRAALVGSQDLEFGLSRIYKVLVESKISTTVKVFRSLDEALRWLKS